MTENAMIRCLAIQMTQNMANADEALARHIQDAVVGNFLKHPQRTTDYLRNSTTLIEQLKTLDRCFIEPTSSEEDTL